MHLVVIAENRLSAGFEIGEFEPRADGCCALP